MYNNFLNPVRRPNSSLFIPNTYGPTINNNQVNGIYNNPPKGLYNNQHLLSKNSLNQTMPIVKNRKLNDIINEKKHLLSSLKEKEKLERDIIEKTEIAIRKQHETELNNVQFSIENLKNQLEEKEKLEKWVIKRREEFLKEIEIKELERIRTSKYDLLHKINQQEKNITKIKEDEELRDLQKEKELLSNKYKQMELDEMQRVEMEINQEKIEMKKKRERNEIQNLELMKIQRESEHLRKSIQHKNNQEKWLNNKMKLEANKSKTYERLKNLQNSLEKDRIKLETTQRKPTYNFKKDTFYNNYQNNDGYSSDNEGNLPDTESLLNNKMFSNKTIDKQNVNQPDKQTANKPKKVANESHDSKRSKYENTSDLDYADIIKKIEKDLANDTNSILDKEKLKLILNSCKIVNNTINKTSDVDSDSESLLNDANFSNINNKTQILPIQTEIESDPTITSLHNEIFDIKSMINEKEEVKNKN